MQPNIIVQAPARLDVSTSGEFSNFLHHLINAGAHRVILDLGRLEYISSAGVRVLLLVHQTLEAKKGGLALLSCQAHVREVLRICGVENLAPHAESIEAARRLVE
jgi:stage II sporulation protein AA (anti-sigma F factor antagonist)